MHPRVERQVPGGTLFALPPRQRELTRLMRRVVFIAINIPAQPILLAIDLSLFIVSQVPAVLNSDHVTKVNRGGNALLLAPTLVRSRCHCPGRSLSHHQY